VVEGWPLALIDLVIVIGYRLGLRFAFEVMRTNGDCGLRSHGNKQLRESFAADPKSQVQRDSRRYQSVICHLSSVICHLS
jgi:hypothetical protein